MKYFLLASIFVVGEVLSEDTYAIDERWVCNIKKSCLDCLHLPHCSWCEKSDNCFSKYLPDMEDYCTDNAIHYVDHGMSIEENAKCTCIGAGAGAGEALERNCIPPGATDGVECFGRGTCECGRCACDLQPDPRKRIMGEYCEFDNFSCDGPHCNEGPYHINQVYDLEDMK